MIEECTIVLVASFFSCKCISEASVCTYDSGTCTVFTSKNHAIKLLLSSFTTRCVAITFYCNAILAHQAAVTLFYDPKMNAYTPPTLVSAPQTPIDYQFPRHSSWRVSAHSPTASYSEIDYDDASSILSHIRPTGWRGVFREGGLGIYLLSTNKGWKVYVGLLCAAAIGSGCAVLTLDWFIMKGRYSSIQYTYPISEIPPSCLSIPINHDPNTTHRLPSLSMVIIKLYKACIDSNNRCWIGRYNCPFARSQRTTSHILKIPTSEIHTPFPASLHPS